MRQVIETARRVTGHAIPVIESPRRDGDPVTLVASSEKIRHELGWQPRFPDLEQIMRSGMEVARKPRYPEDDMSLET